MKVGNFCESVVDNRIIYSRHRISIPFHYVCYVDQIYARDISVDINQFNYVSNLRCLKTTYVTHAETLSQGPPKNDTTYVHM